eukprot:CAMPEP_0180109784 /NCGR_PEP_ID=MMETSP0985-20121206/34674_1 /TAXON_ID=483367 /ORGANISM="non described non described, Strain CCMP 2436" /LENGTH=84 /DNA_ID=CAMNT_0022047725 /DNA_START=161 /DNA_END=415 /DNA_ORIENTATION=-
MLEARRPTVGEAATKPASTEEFAPVLEGASGALFGDPSEISKAAAEEAEEEEEEEKEEGVGGGGGGEKKGGGGYVRGGKAKQTE